jgi:hypothetical protein
MAIKDKFSTPANETAGIIDELSIDHHIQEEFPNLASSNGEDVNLSMSEYAAGAGIAAGAQIKFSDMFGQAREAIYHTALVTDRSTDYGYINFGISVAIDGETMVIGAASDFENGDFSGSAFIYTRTGGVNGTWSLQQKITASDGIAHDNFGSSVSIDGNTVVVGAYVNSYSSYGREGRAYVFVRNGTTWTEQQKLTASDGTAGDYFGAATDISGDTVVVGALSDDHTSVNAGSAYVYVRNGTTWTQQKKLTASDPATTDQFGSTVAIDGNTVIIGAAYDDDLGAFSGSAYIFVRNGTTWTQQKKLNSNATQGIGNYDLFGSSVDIHGETVVIGAIGAGNGEVHVYTRTGTNWFLQQKLTASDGAAYDSFGYSVAIYDDVVVMGAVGDDDKGERSGSAYAFTRSGTTWTQQQKLLTNSSNHTSDVYFGQSIAVSGLVSVVGAPNPINYEPPGSAYIFRSGKDTWKGPMEY